MSRTQENNDPRRRSLSNVGFLWFFRITYGVLIFILIAFFTLEIFHRFFGFFPTTNRELGPIGHLTVLPIAEITSVASTTATTTIAAVPQWPTAYDGAGLSPVLQTETDNSGSDVISIIGMLSIYGAVLAYVFTNVVQTKLESRFDQEHQNARGQIRKIARFEREMSTAEMRSVISYIFTKVLTRDESRYKELIGIASAQDELIAKALQEMEDSLSDLKTLGDGFEEHEYKRVVLRSHNHTAYHLAELQDIRSRETGGRKDAINDDYAGKAKRHTKIIREAIDRGEIERLQLKTYLYKETCAWVDWVFACGTEEQMRSQKGAALQEFERLKSCSPQVWYKEIKKKYIHH